MNKRGEIWDTLKPWVIGIAVLVIIAVFAYFLKDNLKEYAEYLRNLI